MTNRSTPGWERSIFSVEGEALGLPALDLQIEGELLGRLLASEFEQFPRGGVGCGNLDEGLIDLDLVVGPGSGKTTWGWLSVWLVMWSWSLDSCCRVVWCPFMLARVGLSDTRMKKVGA